MSNFKCWIPNVSGCLSFSNIKGIRIPGRSEHPKTINRLSDDSKGYIYSLQKRNLSDTIYARIDRGGEFYYLLSAHVERTSADQEVLEGTIYTYPLRSLDREETCMIKSFWKCKSDPTDITQKLIAKRLQNLATVMVTFKLHRDGVAEFSCTESDVKKCNSFTLEAYSFLKDLIHSHKFHRYDDDAIVVPYPVTDDTDHKWAEKTIRNLHKSIVSTYRNTTYEFDLINAIGRLSYLESFQHVLSERKLSQRPNINTSILRGSLETKLISMASNGAGKAIILQIFVPTFFALLALLIGMSQLLQVPCIEGITFSDTCKSGSFKLPAAAFNIVKIELAHWYQLAVILPTLTVVFLIWAHLSSIYHWLTQYLGRGLIGWFQRVTFCIAVSDWYGRFMATVWVVMLVFSFILLMYYASGHLLAM